tara:strand:- start:197 stop:676 length:480 start_codon:yes stop_codon:yes gene_type:complete
VGIDFDKAVNEVIKKEGGFVDDPLDKGGETKYGISKRQYPHLDIRNLTKDDAKKIYYDDYWKQGKVSQVPELLRHVYFDMCVNFGIRGAVRVLQEAANNKNKRDIKVDGLFGPNTRKAIQKIEPDRLRSFRVLKFAKIVLKDRGQSRFWYGWFRRAISV